jgi:hypothetical protein
MAAGICGFYPANATPDVGPQIQFLNGLKVDSDPAGTTAQARLSRFGRRLGLKRVLKMPMCNVSPIPTIEPGTVVSLKRDGRDTKPPLNMSVLKGLNGLMRNLVCLRWTVVAQRAVALVENDTISSFAFAPAVGNAFDAAVPDCGSISIPIGTTVDEATKRLVQASIEQCAGTKLKAAQMLGIPARPRYQHCSNSEE